MRRRKFQDAALRDALEEALAAGEPVNVALARLRVSRSTLRREMTRDDDLRERIERALLADRQQPRGTTDADDADAAAQVIDVVPTAAGAEQSITSTPIGTGRVVFGLRRRPRPLESVRRMALRSAVPWPSARNGPLRDRIVLRDWLPALLVLLAEAALAFASTGSPVIVVLVVMVALAYVGSIWVVSASEGTDTLATSGAVHASSGLAPAAAPPRTAAPPRPHTTPPSGTVRTDLGWLQDTIGRPVGVRRPTPPKRDRPRG